VGPRVRGLKEKSAKQDKQNQMKEGNAESIVWGSGVRGVKERDAKVVT
jgi:hypothetical protein